MLRFHAKAVGISRSGIGLNCYIDKIPLHIMYILRNYLGKCSTVRHLGRKEKRVGMNVKNIPLMPVRLDLE